MALLYRQGSNKQVETDEIRQSLPVAVIFLFDPGWASYQIHKILQVEHVPGIPGTLFPSTTSKETAS